MHIQSFTSNNYSRHKSAKAQSKAASNSGRTWYERCQAPNGYPEVFHEFSSDSKGKLQPFRVAIHNHSYMQHYTNNAVEKVSLYNPIINHTP